MLTGRFIDLGGEVKSDALSFVKRLTGRTSEPVIRQAMRHAMRIMGRQFVLGRTIKEALTIARPLHKEGYRFSFDMLGEAAMTMADADRYLASYSAALADVAGAGDKSRDVFAQPSISVKLSALHPRYQEKERGRTMDELLPRVAGLAADAKRHGIGLTIDAEEMDRLELSLELFGRLAHDPALAGWNGLGLAVQAYSKRCLPLLEWLEKLATQSGRVLPVRLVKGAYWDTEIKRAQEGGFADFPLFSRKVSTDVSYLACAKFLLQHRERFYPQFATHNAHSLAAVATMAGNREGFEFQRLHGMGQALYDEVVGRDRMNLPCRIYAPVGSHEDLLAYLVRRLLENGANTSFVHRLADDDAPIREIIADPVEQAEKLHPVRHPRIALPARIFGARTNSAGIPMWDNATRQPLVKGIEKALAKPVEAGAIVNGKTASGGAARTITSPHDRSVTVGSVREAGKAEIEAALAAAHKARGDWNALGGEARAKILDKVADLYERDHVTFMALLVREAGKTLDNAQADLREAVDFLRYYASRSPRQVRRARHHGRAHRRAQSVDPQRARGVCLYLPVEFSARHLHRADCRGAGGR